MRFLLVFVFTLTAVFGYAHQGGLDSKGGHTDRKTGVYHCHKSTCIERATLDSGEYNRDDWPHWSDLDGDCMNTRHEMLLAQVDGAINLSPDGCYVNTGTWKDPFSGKVFHRASELDVDHIIPLKWAHDHGGAQWTKIQKEAFANDPLNLLVVDDGLNQSKGAKGPNEWLPPNQAYRCEYLARWQTILKKYPTLKMTSAKNRIFNTLNHACIK